MAILSDPVSDHDFITLIEPKKLAELTPGHLCVPVKDAPPSVKPGTNATLQIKYTAIDDKPNSETFYACADITYVEFPNFKEDIKCFDMPPDTGSGTNTGSGTSTGSVPIGNSASDSSKGSSGGSGGLSGGATAGIVVGVVAAVSMLAAGLMIYRRKQQRLRILRQQNSPRNVKWDEQPRDSNSNKSVRLQNLS